MEAIYQKYAQLLTYYCLEVKPGDKIFIKTTTLAEPLLKAVYQTAYAAGAALVEYEMGFQNKDKLFFDNAGEIALQTPPPLLQLATAAFNAHLTIEAPFETRQIIGASARKTTLRNETLAPIRRLWSQRTASNELRRTLCLFPTPASAVEAGMSFADFNKFVFNACKLFDDDPAESWRIVRKNQQHIVDFLNKKSQIRFVTTETDLSFSTKGRIWINSDGQTNMPSGEVYTSPVENSVQGRISFSLPCLFQGEEVEGVTLLVKDGRITHWDAKSGKDVLNRVFEIPGARHFGEAAIGTNYNITRRTRNLLFDEKMGGTIHMAIGESYPQTGGVNQSPIHWDLITDMQPRGEIWADDEKIYENGHFII